MSLFALLHIKMQNYAYCDSKYLLHNPHLNCSDSSFEQSTICEVCLGVWFIFRFLVWHTWCNRRKKSVCMWLAGEGGGEGSVTYFFWSRILPPVSRNGNIFYHTVSVRNEWQIMENFGHKHLKNKNKKFNNKEWNLQIRLKLLSFQTFSQCTLNLLHSLQLWRSMGR